MLRAERCAESVRAMRKINVRLHFRLCCCLIRRVVSKTAVLALTLHSPVRFNNFTHLLLPICNGMEPLEFGGQLTEASHLCLKKFQGAWDVENLHRNFVQFGLPIKGINAGMAYKTSL